MDLNDLELVLIALQVIIQTNQSFKRRNTPYEEHFASKPNNIKFKDEKDSSVSATSISEVTGVPRATCIRKLEKLVSLGMLVQEKKTKRYKKSLKKSLKTTKKNLKTNKE